MIYFLRITSLGERGNSRKRKKSQSSPELVCIVETVVIRLALGWVISEDHGDYISYLVGEGGIGVYVLYDIMMTVHMYQTNDLTDEGVIQIKRVREKSETKA